MDKKLCQLAGEYYTLAKLYEKGYMATKAPEGMELFDILIGEETGMFGGLPIQVKSSEDAYVEMKRKTDQHPENYYKFSIGAKINKIKGEKFIYVLVNLNKGNPQFFVIPVKEIKKYVDAYEWCDDGNWITFEINESEKDKYLEKWDIIKEFIS
ncbi:MAG: hypothetical protein R6U63_02510 [Longimicrobiales bacterium]